MNTIFLTTGVIVWVIIILIILYAVCCFIRNHVYPSLGNLWFVILSYLPWDDDLYVDMWTQLRTMKGRYFFYTRGKGNCNFARCAVRRLVLRARKARRKNNK